MCPREDVGAEDRERWRVQDFHCCPRTGRQRVSAAAAQNGDECHCRVLPALPVMATAASPAWKGACETFHLFFFPYPEEVAPSPGCAPKTSETPKLMPRKRVTTPPPKEATR